jgi:hypothetical protein
LSFPVTINGDIFVYSGGAPARLPIGAAGSILTVVAGEPTWYAPTTNGYVLTIVSGVPTWTAASASGVTSVGLADASGSAIYTITNSPVTSSGTLTITLKSQTANEFFAAPNGSAGQPTFRAIVAADLPPIPYDITLASIGVPPTSGSIITGLVATRLITLPINLTGSYAVTDHASSSSETVLTIDQNGIQIGSITFAISATSATFAFASAVTLNPGDILTVVASTPVATDIGDIYITLAGTAVA